MEYGKAIEVTQEQIDDFFKDMRQAGYPLKEYTPFEEKIIITAYEKGYNKDETARRLKTNVKKMKRYWLEYLDRKKEQE